MILFDNEPCKTPSEFGAKYRLSAATVRQMCARGEIPGAFRVSDGRLGRWCITPEAEREWVRSRQRKSRPPDAAPEDRPDMHACCARIVRSLIARGERKRAESLIRDIVRGKRDALKTWRELERELGGSSPAVVEMRA